MRWSLLSVLLFACGDGVGLTDSGGDGTLPAACDDGAPVDTYVAGLSRTSTSGAFELVMTSADPAPPDVGDNTFVLELMQGGAKVPGASVVVRPWMSLHGHGASPETYDGADDGSGTYTAGPMDLFMPGLWELNIELDSGGVTDEALFRFCLEG